MNAPATVPADAATLKAELHHIIDEIADPAVLQAALVLLQPQLTAQAGDFWDEMTPQEQELLQQSIADADAGRVENFQDVLTRLRK